MGDQIKEDETGGACGTYGGGMHTGAFVGKKLKERAYSEDLDVDFMLFMHFAQSICTRYLQIISD